MWIHTKKNIFSGGIVKLMQQSHQILRTHQSANKEQVKTKEFSQTWFLATRYWQFATLYSLWNTLSSLLVLIVAKSIFTPSEPAQVPFADWFQFLSMLSVHFSILYICLPWLIIKGRLILKGQGNCSIDSICLTFKLEYSQIETLGSLRDKNFKIVSNSKYLTNLDISCHLHCI